MKIIFGTSSKWRQKFFDQFGFEYKIMSADIDEKSIRLDDPKKLTLAIAKAKADDILKKITEDVILVTFDQVVACNGIIYEKPKDQEEMRQFWKSYEKYPALTYSAVAVTDSVSGRQFSDVDIASVFFNPVPADVLQKILADDNMYTSSGGFMINYPLTDSYIKSTNGDIGSVEGIPVELTKNLISRLIRARGDKI